MTNLNTPVTHNEIPISNTTPVMKDIGGAYTPHFAEVPLDIYNFFGEVPGTPSGKTFERMKAVANWAFGDGSTLGEGLQKLKSLEIKLGQARLGENKLQRIANYVKLDRQVNELRMRQEAI